MMQDFLSHFAVTLPAVFFVVDPFGVVPIFLAMTAGDPESKVRSMAFRASLVGAGLLVFFAIFGGLLFKVLGVTLSAFKVAGGILLLITSFDMLRARPSQTRTSPPEQSEATTKDDVAIVPLAMPLLAGPGSIATVMVLVSKGPAIASAISVLISIVLTFVASYLILRAAAVIQRVLKHSGVAILERLFGLILAAIAVQFMLEGTRDLLRLR
jgi:multiple antibiotic resistance protein